MHEHFGTYGAWLNPGLGDTRINHASALEDLGYRTIWAGIGAEPIGDLSLLEQLLAATRAVTIATAIINMWQDSADSVAANYHRLTDRFGPRLLLGVGLGHPESMQTYQQPYQHIVRYLAVLLGAGVPPEALVVGALGPKTIELSGARTPT